LCAVLKVLVDDPGQCPVTPVTYLQGWTSVLGPVQTGQRIDSHEVIKIGATDVRF